MLEPSSHASPSLEGNPEGSTSDITTLVDPALHGVSTAMDSSGEARISGYDLVTKVLDHPDGGVGALIDLAGGAETDWLEYKAAMVGRHEDRRNPKENDTDGHWNVAEAVLAMANTRGGAVLVGIDDDGNTVGLQSGDPRKVIEEKGLETYRRIEIKDRIHRPSGPCRWETGAKGTWELEEAWPPDQFSVRGATHNGHDIAIILVRPVPANGSCIIVLHNGEERLLWRTPGHVGQVKTEKGRRAIEAVESSRSTVSPELFALWERFRRRVEEPATGDDDLEAAISAWHVRFRNKVADLLVSFTPLDAEENPIADEAFETPVPRDLFEPHATEILPDYLRDDFYDDAESEDGGDDAEEDDLDDYSSDHPMRRGGLFELLAAEPRAVVLGEPGGGKTTCLRRLALDAVTDYQPGGQVTLYVPLARWQAAGGLRELLRQCTGLSLGQVERLIAGGRCRLLLDALNECPDTLRPTAVNAVTDILREYPKLPVVISARTSESTARFRLPTFSVEPLNGDRRKAFLHAYLGNPERADQLLEQIYNQPGGGNLASNPLLLRMIVEVVRQGGDLPAGRALLYRQWISDWYRRESKKASSAGDPLPWDLDETRRGLAAIALASRREGLSIADDELALESLTGVVADPARFLERMTDGPLLLREEGRLEFRHETFQEYLCAEALLADPRALRNAGPHDYGRWGMALAYAAEMAHSFPNDLMAATWRISPWLGAALSKPGYSIPKLPSVFLPLIRWFLCGEMVADSATKLQSPGWYRADGPLRYTVNRLPILCKKWHRFEISQLQVAWHPAMAVSVLRRSIALTCEGKKTTPKEHRLPIGSWLRRIDPKTCELLRFLTNSGILRAGELDQFKRKWLRHPKPAEAVALLKAGICLGEDFAEQRTEWMQRAHPSEAAALVREGILKPEDFAGRLNEWMQRAEPDEAAALVREGILQPEDFAGRRSEWMQQAKPCEAAALVSDGLLQPEDFAGRRWEWMQQAKPNQAAALVREGILKPEDFAGRRSEWMQRAKPSELKKLAEAGITTQVNPSAHALRPQTAMDLDHSKKLQSSGDDSTGWIAPSPLSLETAALREETYKFLNDRYFEGIIGYVATGGLLSFIECPAFKHRLFCLNFAWLPGSVAMETGLKVCFQVTIQKNKKKDVWGYAAKNVKVLKDPGG